MRRRGGFFRYLVKRPVVAGTITLSTFGAGVICCYAPRPHDALTLEDYLTQAERHFCSPKDRERFLKAIEGRKENGTPFKKVVGRYDRLIPPNEYVDKMNEIQDKIGEYIRKATGTDYVFDPLLPRHVFWTDSEGTERQVRLGRLLKKLKVPAEIQSLMTRFPTKIGDRVTFEISTDPVDLLTKSTGRAWAATSCERLGGAYDDGPFSDIKNNNAIVFLYRPGKREPFGRYMLRWCTNDEGNVDIGVEPTMYPPSNLNWSLRSELVALLREQGFVNYQECKTPYKYKGYSDRKRGRGIITYSEKVQPISILLRELEREFQNASGSWTGLEWDLPIEVRQATWSTPLSVILDDPDDWSKWGEQYEWNVSRIMDVGGSTFGYDARIARTVLDANEEDLEKTLGYEPEDGPYSLIELAARLGEHGGYGGMGIDEDDLASLSFLKSYTEEIYEDLDDDIIEELAQKMMSFAADLSDKFEVEGSRWTQVNAELISSDADPEEVAEEEGITLAGAETIIAAVEEVEGNAVSAQRAGERAFAAAREGRWDRALDAANAASGIELEYGDDPTWGPFRLAIEEAAAGRGG